MARVHIQNRACCFLDAFLQCTKILKKADISQEAQSNKLNKVALAVNINSRVATQHNLFSSYLIRFYVKSSHQMSEILG